MTNDKLIALVNEKFQIEIRTKLRTNPYTFSRMVFYTLSRDLVKNQRADDYGKEIGFNKSCCYLGVKRFRELYDQPMFRPYRKGYLEILKKLT